MGSLDVIGAFVLAGPGSSTGKNASSTTSRLSDVLMTSTIDADLDVASGRKVMW